MWKSSPDLKQAFDLAVKAGLEFKARAEKAEEALAQERARRPSGRSDLPAQFHLGRVRGQLVAARDALGDGDVRAVEAALSDIAFCLGQA